jgi:hypothetical protein
MCSVDPTRDSQFKRTVLLLRAPIAVDQCKKKPGYRSEILAIVELVVADLTLSKGLVVLQAVRKDADFQQMGSFSWPSPARIFNSLLEPTSALSPTVQFQLRGHRNSASKLSQ